MQIDYKKLFEDKAYYDFIYQLSVKDESFFWNNFLSDFDWHINPKNSYNPSSNQWLEGGEASICYNCVDRHALASPDKKAIVCHGDNLDEKKIVTYRELYELVIKIASLLKFYGIKKNDIVGIYMPMVPEAIASMFACSRLGALHLVVFAGFSSEALAYRLKTSNAKVIITTTSFNRGGKVIYTLANVKAAVDMLSCKILNLDDLPNIPIDKSLVYQNHMDELFVLYTSGSTGEPKPIVHRALSYLLYVAVTFKVIFGILENDIYFCTSDIGWITGHSYVAYAPFFYGLTNVIFEGTPIYPTPDRYWRIISQERVNIFYTTPTSIRSLQSYGDSFVNQYDLSSLRVLGSVGEPLNTSAWHWFFDIIGKKRCPIMDTWWQTETGGFVLAPLRTLDQKPSVAGRPFFGVEVSIVDSRNIIKNSETPGVLVINNNWPGKFFRMLHGPEICMRESFSTADGAIYTHDGQIKIIGRIDDVINISGRRLGTAEFESVINIVTGVKESAVVAVDHDIKGQVACAFIVLIDNYDQTDREKIKYEIMHSIKKKIGSIANLHCVLFVSDLPKTRSGKILRKVLKYLANKKTYDFIDISSVYNVESIKTIEKEIYNVI